MATTNKEILEKLNGFMSQYQVDMHGDNDLSNGNLGVVGEIRAIKKELVTLKEDVADNKDSIEVLEDSDNRWKVIAILLGGIGGIGTIASMLLQ